MDMIVSTIFADLDSQLVASVLGLAMLIAWALGRWHGRRMRAEVGEVPSSKFEDASLALLSLLLGFTFSMAILKHDQRRLMVVADSNAIGDFYICASLLEEPVRTKLQTVIRQYVRLRLELSSRRLDEAAFERALGQMQQMHAEMNELVRQALEAGTPIAGSLTNTLNGVTSNHASRLAAIRDRLPTNIVLLLLISAVACSMLVGREQGASNRADLAGTVCFIVLVSFALYVTLDLNQPDRGLITVSQEPMRRLLTSMAK
jgi:hypothetical protein